MALLQALFPVVAKSSGHTSRRRTPLLESPNTRQEYAMIVEPPRPLAETPTPQLVSRLMQSTKELVRAEVALAKAELKNDLERELRMVEGLAIAAVCGLCTLNLLLVAAVLGLAQTALPGWAAALIVAGGVLAIGAGAGLIGWAMRVKAPLEKTRRTLKEDVRWAKERMA